MRINIKYFFLLLLSFSAGAQILEQPLAKAHCRLFGGSIYTYGLLRLEKNTRLCIYKIDQKLKVVDSNFVDLGKQPVTDFLQMYSDTIHDFLNIYLQQKEKKLVHVFRFTKQFRLLANIENVDVARLNSISAFESEIFYSGRDVYSVNISRSDSSGRQFYLNKYSLKSELKNFEYDPRWQFPFEKKHINSAHISIVTKRYVLLYVNVTEGAKQGQWFLHIDPFKGTLIRGTKINSKGDHGFYAYGPVCPDSVTNEIYMLGQKFTEAEFSQKDNKLNIANKPFTTLYLARFDSSADLTSREEFRVPVAETKGNKNSNAYILRPIKLRITKENGFLFETDIYKGNKMCFLYCNTQSNAITANEGKVILDKGAVTTNTLIEKYYFNSDYADMNGKLCADSLRDFEKLYYKTIPFEVKADFKSDERSSPVWILKKSDAKKKVENYTILKQEKKIYRLSVPEEISKTEEPQLFVVFPGQYVIARQLSEDKFQLKLSTW